MGFLTAYSFRIMLLSLVAVGAVRVVFPDAGRANPVGDDDQVTAAYSRPEWTLTFVDRNFVRAGFQCASDSDSSGMRGSTSDIGAESELYWRTLMAR